MMLTLAAEVLMKEAQENKGRKATANSNLPGVLGGLAIAVLVIVAATIASFYLLMLLIARSIASGGSLFAG